jgi:hypothetical protein
MPPGRPATWRSRLWGLLAHGIHFFACGIGPWRTSRHDRVGDLIGGEAVRELRAIVSTKERLHTGAKNNEKIDLVIDADGAEPPVTTLDVTISCPLLPTYVDHAALDCSEIFTRRDRQKTKKHLPGCILLLRSYLSAVYTTFAGMGPPTARDYVDSFYRPAYTSELLAGGTGTQTARRRQNHHFCVCACIARQNLAMIQGLTAPPRAPAAAAPHPDEPNNP